MKLHILDSYWQIHPWLAQLLTTMFMLLGGCWGLKTFDSTQVRDAGSVYYYFILKSENQNTTLKLWYFVLSVFFSAFNYSQFLFRQPSLSATPDLHKRQSLGIIRVRSSRTGSPQHLSKSTIQ